MGNIMSDDDEHWDEAMANEYELDDDEGEFNKEEFFPDLDD